MQMFLSIKKRTEHFSENDNNQILKLVCGKIQKYLHYLFLI